LYTWAGVTSATVDPVVVDAAAVHAPDMIDPAASSAAAAVAHPARNAEMARRGSRRTIPVCVLSVN
jgi:hypothetical protein